MGWPLTASVGIALGVGMCGGQPASAQAPAAAIPDPSAVDPSSIPLPNLEFAPTAEDESNYDKYFYFHRTDTDFATAYADLRECDNYARNLSFRLAGVGMHGAIGNMVANSFEDALHGSPVRRQQRRSIMRICMGFKGYQAYGLRKSLWTPFNFEEGNERIAEAERQRLLRIQARVASGSVPNARALTP